MPPSTPELTLPTDDAPAIAALARALADVSDSRKLLATLCASAASHVAADGASVSRILGEQDEVLAATGCLESDRNGTLGHSSSERDRVLKVPLVAHQHTLGVLTVVRGTDRPPFTSADESRLGVIADLASLALWKTRLLDEAQAANVSKSSFLTAISHELRTPLTALTGYGELLADEILGPLNAKQHDAVARMRSVTTDLAGMIEEILTYASLDAGRERIVPRDIHTTELLSATAAMIEPLARKKNLAFQWNGGTDALLFTDPERVKQVLVNLAANAVKFTDHGSVSLTLTRAHDEVRFHVVDTGPGISAADQQRLFQPFTQLEDNLTRRHGGTGLGLYISRRLATLLGGRVELDSTIGEGSKFTLAIPVSVR